MRAMSTFGVLLVLVLAVGVGRGGPPSGPASPPGPTLAPAPIPALPTIPPARLNWSKSEKIDTPVEKAETKKLKDEVDKLMNEHPEPKPGKAEPADERDRLRNKLDELLEQLKEQKKSVKPSSPPTKPHDPHDPHPPTPIKPVVIPEGGKPIDLVRAAGNLYKAGDLEGAFGIVKVLDAGQLPKEDKAFAEYIRAACLRKQGKLTDALTVYKAIADAKDDPFLAECAVVQITAMKSTLELEAQLEQLKSRRKPK